MIPASLMEAIRHEASALERLSARIGERVAGEPQALLQRGRPLAMPGAISANGSAQMMKARDGWLAINLARPEDVASLPAWLQADLPGDPVAAMVSTLRHQDVAPLIDQARLLGLPVAAVGKTAPSAAPVLAQAENVAKSGEVIDLSTLWAGPLCAGLLARAGLPVTRLDNVRRPDPTARHDPILDAALNSRKRREVADFASCDLPGRIAKVRVLVTSGRPHALARLGLTPSSLFACNPGLLWVAITAHGWHGEAGMRVGFGDDCAAAGGLVRWQDGAPRFIGDALADPLTGLHAARLVMEALAEGRGGLLDVPLAGTAARFARQAGLS